MDILRDPKLSQYYTTVLPQALTVLLKSRSFSFQILAKFKVAKTESAVGFLRLIAVCSIICSD